MGGLIGRVRRGAMWLAGGFSLVLGVALVYLVVTPGAIGQVGTAALGAVLGLLVLPGVTLGAVRNEQRTRAMVARARQDAGASHPDVIGRIGPDQTRAA